MIVEYAVIRLTIVASGESKAKADLRVAEAEQETARLRAKVDPRRLNIEVLLKAIEGLPKPTTEVRVLHLKNDNEASSLAWQIAFALGDGSELRQPLGVAVVGGLVVSQILTLYITPVIYLYVERASGAGRSLRRFLRGQHKTEAMAGGPAE